MRFFHPHFTGMFGKGWFPINCYSCYTVGVQHLGQLDKMSKIWRTRFFYSLFIQKFNVSSIVSCKPCEGLKCRVHRKTSVCRFLSFGFSVDRSTDFSIPIFSGHFGDKDRWGDSCNFLTISLVISTKHGWPTSHASRIWRRWVGFLGWETFRILHY